MKEPNLKIYCENVALIEKLSEKKTCKLFSGIYEAIALIYFLFALVLMMEYDSLDIEETLTVVFYVSAFIDILCSIILFVKQIKKQIVPAYNISVVIAAIWLAFSLFVLVSGEYDYLNKASIVYTVSFIVVVIIDKFLFFYVNSKNSVLISNLKKGYLDIREKSLCGISYSNIELTGNGEYFEIEYKDIKNIRRGDSGDKYYNLFIDHKHGTYKLSVNKVHEAFATIVFIIKKLNSGEDPFENKPEYSVADNETVEKGEYSPAKVIGSLKECPKCGKCQGISRTQCYGCGYPI